MRGLSEGRRQRAPQPLHHLGGLRTFLLDIELGSALGDFLTPNPSAHLPKPCCEYSESGTETPFTPKWNVWESEHPHYQGLPRAGLVTAG